MVLNCACVHWVVRSPFFGKGVHQDISGTMQEETEVIGFEGVAGGTIGMEEGFVILDEVFHPAART